MNRWHLVLGCTIVALVASSCVKLPRRAASLDGQNAPHAATHAPADNLPRVNLNTATPAELEKLPGIGASLAARIVEHRARYGAFRRAEHLLLVRGISARRFRELRAQVTVE